MGKRNTEFSKNVSGLQTIPQKIHPTTKPSHGYFFFFPVLLIRRYTNISTSWLVTNTSRVRYQTDGRDQPQFQAFRTSPSAADEQQMTSPRYLQIRSLRSFRSVCLGHDFYSSFLMKWGVHATSSSDCSPQSTLKLNSHLKWSLTEAQGLMEITGWSPRKEPHTVCHLLTK